MSMPPTNAISSSTTTSFSWWQCSGRSCASRAHADPRAARRARRAASRTAARPRREHREPALPPRAARARRRAPPPRRSSSRRSSGGSSRSRANSRRDAPARRSRRCARAPRTARAERRAGPRHPRPAPRGCTRARRRSLARPQGRRHQAGAAPPAPDPPQPAGVVQRHRALDRAPQPTVERAERIHAAASRPRARAPARVRNRRSNVRPSPYDVERRTFDPAVRLRIQFRRAILACMQASGAAAHVSPAELAAELIAPLAPPHEGRVEGALRAARRARPSFIAHQGAARPRRPRTARVSVKELAEELGLSLPGASRAVDALLQRGLVERREDEHDRRMKRAARSPTPAASSCDRVDDGPPARPRGLRRRPLPAPARALSPRWTPSPDLPKEPAR